MLRVIHISDLHFHWNNNDNQGALRLAVVHNRVQVVAFGHSGGNHPSKERPPEALVPTEPRAFGVKYLLNANSCVAAQQYYEIVCNGDAVSVTLH